MRALSLEEQLERSIHQVRAKKLYSGNVADWIEAIPEKKMTQAIVQHQEPTELTAWRAMREQANELVQSGFLPKAVNTPEKAMAIIQTGKELGLGPMQSLRSIHIIEGKPTMSADLIAGLALAKVPGSVLRVTETTDTKCVIKAGRAGAELTTFTYTFDDAKRAGLTGKQNWRNYPRAMLRARAITEAARAIFPDAVMGLYDPDEVGAVTSPSGEVIQVTDITPHAAPDQSADDLPTGGGAAGNLMLSKLVDLEAAVDAIDSYVLTLRARELLGGKGHPAVITKGLSEKIQTGEISPAQQTAIGKIAQRLNRKLVKLEAKYPPPPIESSFVDEPDGTEALAPGREPGDDADEDPL